MIVYRYSSKFFIPLIKPLIFASMSRATPLPAMRSVCNASRLITIVVLPVLVPALICLPFSVLTETLAHRVFLTLWKG